MVKEKEHNHEHEHEHLHQHNQSAPEISQELMFKLQMYEQHIQQLQQQIQAVQQGIGEMNSLNEGLSEIIGKKDKEIFASIGRGIFAKARLISEQLSVDVGGGNFVQKSIPQTQEIIAQQIKKLEEVQQQLEDNLEKVGREIEKMIRKEQEKEKKK